MTASRITVEGDAIEIAGRFTNEAEIDAFIERVWTVFFAVHPPAEDGEGGAAPINSPPLGGRGGGGVGASLAYVPAIHESVPQRPGADARHKAGHETPSAPPRVEDDVEHDSPPGPVTAEDAAAFARLSSGERRAVLLMRKHRDRNAVAKIMEINPNSVTNYISAARNKGVVV